MCTVACSAKQCKHLKNNKPLFLKRGSEKYFLCQFCFSKGAIFSGTIVGSRETLIEANEVLSLFGIRNGKRVANLSLFQKRTHSWLPMLSKFLFVSKAFSVVICSTVRVELVHSLFLGTSIYLNGCFSNILRNSNETRSSIPISPFQKKLIKEHKVLMNQLNIVFKRTQKDVVGLNFCFDSSKDKSQAFGSGYNCEQVLADMLQASDHKSFRQVSPEFRAIVDVVC